MSEPRITKEIKRHTFIVPLAEKNSDLEAAAFFKLTFTVPLAKEYSEGTAAFLKIIC